MNATRPSLRNLRAGLLKGLLASAALLIVAAVGENAFTGLYAALSGAAVAVFLASVVGLAVALLWVSSYADERREVSNRLRSVSRYVLRASRWGLAAAGIGTLLTAALPPSLVSGSTTLSASQVPINGWVAITFGGFGIALGILEEFHSRLSHEAGASRG